MPVGIGPADRKLLLIGGSLLVLMLGVTVIFSRPSETLGSPVPSTYSSQPAGAEAAYLLLSRLHYSVRRWESAPTELPAQPGDILLILAEPTQLPSRGEQQALLNFVQDGGHVLFTGASISSFFSDARLSDVQPDPQWRTYSPIIPSSLERGARHVTIQPQAYWGDLSNSQLALFGDSDTAVVVSWRIGRGEILWWAGSTPLSNAGITHEDNLVFFLNSVSSASPDQPYQIYWDEYFHGQRDSLWGYVGRTPLAWGLAQLGLLALVVVFTFSRRSGPVFSPPRVSRLSPLEFVDTLGGLYERAGAAAAAVSVSLVRLRALLARQLSLPGDAPDVELARAAGQRLGWKGTELGDLFVRAGATRREEKLRPREALDIVQELERQAAKLEVRASIRQEKV